MEVWPIQAVAVILSIVAIGAAVYVYNDSFSEREIISIVNENIPAQVDLPKQVLCNADTDCVKWLNGNYAFKSEISDETKQIEVLKKDISSIRIELATVSAKLNQQKNTPVSTQSTSCVSSTMNLKTGSSDPSDIKSTFDRGDIIYIVGKSDSPSASHTMEIVNRGTSQIIDEGTFNSASDGSFTRAYISDSGSLKGFYTVQIETGFTKSCIDFQLK